jgi:hypothetical protein
MRLKRHIKECHDTHVCEECGAIVQSEKSYLNHVRKYHSNPLGPNPGYDCPACDQWMPNRLYRVTVHKCPGNDTVRIMANNLAKKNLLAKPIFEMSLGSDTFRAPALFPDAVPGSVVKVTK